MKIVTWGDGIVATALDPQKESRLAKEVIRCIYAKDYYSVIKKGDIVSLGTKCIELEMIMFSEIRDER